MFKFLKEKLKEGLIKLIGGAYEAREKQIGKDVMRQIEKFAYVGSIDHLWIDHIDGLDGLAAGVTAISAATLFFVALRTHQLGAALMMLALAGAALGFLRYNFFPASIKSGVKSDERRVSSRNRFEW